MDYTVGYTIFNKEHSIIPILNGIAKCFPEDCEVIFHFDACTDRSFNVLQRNKHILGKRKLIVLQNSRDLYELKSNNLLIDTFTKDVLVIFQDDMICIDENLCNRADEIIREYGDSLGLLGARDGFDVEDGNRVNFVKNQWSPSPSPGRILKRGEFVERSFVNRGPIFLTRTTLEKIPGFSEDFYPGSWDDRDFCCRAKYEHGLVNIVMFSRIMERRERKATKLDAAILHRLNGRKFFCRWGKYVGSIGDQHLSRLLWDGLNSVSRSEIIRQMLVSKHRFGAAWFFQKKYNRK